jgi:predicted dehydrogenase
VVEDSYARQKKGDYKGCQVFADFRELLARKDIDAVVIATPDHWHAIQAVQAAEAGKDIYCEKPLTHTVAEGRKITDAVKKAKVVFQTGSQQRSEFADRFRRAVELVRNGRIGKVKTIRVGVAGPPIACDLPEQPVPPGIDWEMWNGPAPKRGYNAVLCPRGVHDHYPLWRRYREYAGGHLADMGAHHFDIAQWALDMDQSGPVKIDPPEDPKAVKGLRLTYANGVVVIHDEFEGVKTGVQIEGSEGTIFVSRVELITEPDTIRTEPLGEKAFRVYPSSNQRKNWLECIRSRKETICPAEVGSRSATVCHLANIGYQLRRPLRWDPLKERFVDDSEADRLLSWTPREPWKL